MSILLGLLILAADPGSAQDRRHPDAVEIFRCAFDESWDVNYDRWPDRWIRRQDRGFPPYLKIDIQDHAGAVAGRCLKIELDGGAATVFSPPIPVDARFSYLLQGKLKTHGLEHDRAFFSVTFYDAKRNPLQTIEGKKLREAADWTRLDIGPVSPRNQDVAVAVIGIHVEPGDRQDLHGWALFDDIWFARLPRMTLSTNSQSNVFTDPDKVQVTCTLSGVAQRDPELKFELIDASGQSIAGADQRLDGKLIEQKSPKTSGPPDGKTNPQAYTGTATWNAPLEDFGFYQVRVTMQSPGGMVDERRITIAAIRPLGRPVAGEFGWTLPRGDDTLPVDALVGLLPHVGISWLKFPVWYDENDNARGDQLMWFAERLGIKGIEMVGLLDRPPDELLKHLSDVEHVSAANIFSADPALWRPALDPVMTRLSLKIRWWQLGGDRDTSFVGYPDLSANLQAIKGQLYRFGQEVHLGIGWRWLAETPPDDNPPWQFLTLSADPPLTGAEMATYLAAAKRKQVQRWALVEPLPRSLYGVQMRCRDLVDQMMSAKIQGAEGIFVPDPFSTEHGLMNDDGTPGELLLPWRTTALVLGGSKYLGSIRMPQGSRNHVFTRGGEAVMAVWNARPTKEVIYLGDHVEQIDLWGRLGKPEEKGHQQVIEVGPLPTFITGLSEPVTRWRMAVEFQRTQLPSVFGKSHPNGIIMKNFFDQGAGGEVALVTPDVWRLSSKKMSFKLAVGEELTKPFEMTLPFDASSGRQDVRLDFDINADRRYRFSVYRELEIGLGDVAVELGTHLDESGALVVEQRMTNNSDQLVDFKCLLYAPNRRRQQSLVFQLGRGQDSKSYRFPDGQELVGETLWLRAEEMGGPRMLNYRFEAKP